jgi:hypothetical protein
MSLRRHAVDRFTGDSPFRRLLRRIDAAVYQRFRPPVGLLVLGIEKCQICGEHITGSEKFDGSYVWPDGLTHYVREHSVRLPREFLDHCSPAASRPGQHRR